MRGVLPGSFVTPAYDDVCLWAKPLQVGRDDLVPIARFDERELLLVVGVADLDTGRFALVVSPSSLALGYVNVRWLNEVLP